MRITREGDEIAVAPHVNIYIAVIFPAIALMASVTWTVHHKSSVNIETYMVALDCAPIINLGFIRFFLFPC